VKVIVPDGQGFDESSDGSIEENFLKVAARSFFQPQYESQRSRQSPEAHIQDVLDSNIVLDVKPVQQLQ